MTATIVDERLELAHIWKGSTATADGGDDQKQEWPGDIVVKAMEASLDHPHRHLRAEKKKRPKKRSRQKNLKRDTRPQARGLSELQ